MLWHGRDDFDRTKYRKIHVKSAMHQIFCRFVGLVSCFEFSCLMISRLLLSRECLFPLSKILENTFFSGSVGCCIFQNWNWYRMHSLPTRMTRRLGYTIGGCWAEVKYINFLFKVNAKCVLRAHWTHRRLICSPQAQS